MTLGTQIGHTVDTLTETAQMVADLLRDGTRAKHEIEMALISLRNLKRELALVEDARGGQVGPPDPPKRDHLRLVK